MRIFVVCIQLYLSYTSSALAHLSTSIPILLGNCLFVWWKWLVVIAFWRVEIWVFFRYTFLGPVFTIDRRMTVTLVLDTCFTGLYFLNWYSCLILLMWKLHSFSSNLTSFVLIKVCACLTTYIVLESRLLETWECKLLTWSLIQSRLTLRSFFPIKMLVYHMFCWRLRCRSQRIS